MLRSRRNIQPAKHADISAIVATRTILFPPLSSRQVYGIDSAIWGNDGCKCPFGAEQHNVAFDYEKVPYAVRRRTAPRFASPSPYVPYWVIRLLLR